MTNQEIATRLRAIVREYNASGNAKQLWKSVEAIAAMLEAAEPAVHVPDVLPEPLRLAITGEMGDRLDDLNRRLT